MFLGVNQYTHHCHCYRGGDNARLGDQESNAFDKQLVQNDPST
jgi:hypothetical protein